MALFLVPVSVFIAVCLLCFHLEVVKLDSPVTSEQMLSLFVIKITSRYYFSVRMRLNGTPSPLLVFILINSTPEPQGSKMGTIFTLSSFSYQTGLVVITLYIACLYQAHFQLGC